MRRSYRAQALYLHDPTSLARLIYGSADAGPCFGAPSMARRALTALLPKLWWRWDDLAVQVRYRPGKGVHREVESESVAQIFCDW